MRLKSIKAWVRQTLEARLAVEDRNLAKKEANTHKKTRGLLAIIPL